LADLTGMEINVPSGLKNWSICSDMDGAYLFAIISL
jgi:hypothetical protein